MDADFQIKSNTGCKDLLLRKLSYAVTCSIFTQIVLLVICIFIANLNIFNPSKWASESFTTLTSFTMWLFIVPFLSVIFAQALICAKDYVYKMTHSSTRIGYILSMFSIRNLILLSLHILSSGFFVWLFLVLSGSDKTLFIKKGETYFVNEEHSFLVVFGIWIGIYYFIWIYAFNKTIIFPVIQQTKLIKLQSNLISILKSCQKDSIYPVVFYVTIYYFYGKRVYNIVSHWVSGESGETLPPNLYTLIYAYFFAILYIFNMKLMRFFFEIFLTEPNEFPIIPIRDGDLTLKDAMDVNYIPIIQHLACLDLFLLSTNSKPRRESIFSLSQPGNHPHNWNSIVDTILRILNEYTRSMNNSITSILSIDAEKKADQVGIPAANQFVKNYNYGNMRNMCLESFDMPIEFVTVRKENLAEEKTQTLRAKLKCKVDSVISIVKKYTGINYLFEDLPVTNIQFLLSNGQIIIWTVQGLSSLTVASLKEDKFGVVQKDLPIILSTLIQLRQGIEKLNRIPTLIRKGQKFDDYANKMKTNINAAVRRSLYHICNRFGPYLKDLPLTNDVLHVLNVYIHQQH